MAKSAGGGAGKIPKDAKLEAAKAYIKASKAASSGKTAPKADEKPQNILDSYFVSIGATADSTSFDKLDLVLRNSGKTVIDYTTGVATAFLKAQDIAVGAIASIGVGMVELANRTAMSDQQYRLFGLRMMMTKESARAMQVSLDELGATIDQVAYDRELGLRFNELYEKNLKLGDTLGKQFDENAIKIRTLNVEFQNLMKSFEFGMQGAIVKLFGKTSESQDENINKFKEWNDILRENLPAITDMVATQLEPAWEDFKIVMTDLGSMVLTAVGDFQFLFGTLQGDDSLKTTEVSLKSISQLFRDIVDDITKVILTFDLWEKTVLHGFMAIVDSALAVGNAFEFVRSKGTDIYAGQQAMSLAGKAKDEAAAYFTNIKDAFTLHKDIYKENPDFAAIMQYNKAHGTLGDIPVPYTNPATPYEPPSTTKGMLTGSFAIMSSYAQLASQQTGIPANWILAQWAHETGGFRSSAFLNNMNAGGIERSPAEKAAGLGTYRKYESYGEFTEDWVKFMHNPRYAGALQATNIEDYAKLLGEEGYYQKTPSKGIVDPIGNYIAGLEAWERKIDKGGDVNIQSMSIVVPPHTPTDQVPELINESFQRLLKSGSQMQAAHTAGAYH